MASLNTLPDCRFALTLGLALALAACGGGGSKDSAASTQSTTSGTAPDGRVAYTWDFEDAAGPGTHQYWPSKDGAAVAVGALTVCGDGTNLLSSSDCSVKQVAGKNGGYALSFDPNAKSSFAWLSGGHSVSACAGDIFQFGDPFGLKQDYRMTVAMWINPERIDPGQTYHLFGTGDPVWSELKDASFHIRLIDGKVRLSMYQGNGYATNPDLTLDSKATFSVTSSGNNWHHIAVTYDNFAVTLFIDGQVDSTATRGADYRAICAGHRPYYVGGLSSLVRVDGGPIEQKSYVFPGVIDQLVFSNKAYTADEILKLAGGVSAK